jgi:hypothetical protein
MLGQASILAPFVLVYQPLQAANPLPASIRISNFITQYCQGQ